MREGNPSVGDHVRVIATGEEGTVEYLEHHQFDVAPTVVGVRYDRFAHSLGEGGEFSVEELEVADDHG